MVFIIKGKLTVVYHVFEKRSSKSVAIHRSDYCHTCAQSKNQMEQTQKPEIMLHSKENSGTENEKQHN